MITDFEAIRFVNEIIRPMAESLRAIKSQIDGASTTWTRLSSLFPNDSSMLADGRDNEGVSRLTGADINAFVSLMGSLQSQMNQVGIKEILEKPCVRTMKVE